MTAMPTPCSLTIINNMYEYSSGTDAEEIYEFDSFVNGTRRLEAFVVPLFNGRTMGEG